MLTKILGMLLVSYQLQNSGLTAYGDEQHALHDV